LAHFEHLFPPEVDVAIVVPSAKITQTPKDAPHGVSRARSA
jgi:hypothetical protein